MKTIVLGAGIVGVTTAWYLAKSGHEVDVIERQPAAGLGTSLANGCVIHVSEVEPWSRPGMPLKVLQWIGKEDAPLLLRLGALPQMWRWGFDFARNCRSRRFRENARSNLDLALLSLRSLQEIVAETGIEYDRAARGVLKIYRTTEALDQAERICTELAVHGLQYERVDAHRVVEVEPALEQARPTLVGGYVFRARRSRRLLSIHTRTGCTLCDPGSAVSLRRNNQGLGGFGQKRVRSYL